MRNFKFIFILVSIIFITTNPVSILSNTGISKSSVQGDWFSRIQVISPGAFTYQIRLHPNGEFQLFKLLLHPDMRWEESRYRGRWNVNVDFLELEVDHCSVYTSRHLIARRALLRSFDCDHLKMEMRILEKGRARLSPTMLGADSEIIFERPPGNPNKKWGLVFFDGNRFIVWGIGLRYYKKGQMGLIHFEDGSKRSVPLVEVVETSAEIKIEGKKSPATGEYFQFP